MGVMSHTAQCLICLALPFLPVTFDHLPTKPNLQPNKHTTTTVTVTAYNVCSIKLIVEIGGCESETKAHKTNSISLVVCPQLHNYLLYVCTCLAHHGVRVCVAVSAYLASSVHSRV